MAKLVIVNKQGALYKPGTILREYDEGYCRQQLTEVSPGRYTYEDVGFMIAHEKLSHSVIPIGKGNWEFDNGNYYAAGSANTITDNGRLISSYIPPQEDFNPD
jgi:hypothetical protein